jgi:hypothetical protein
MSISLSWHQHIVPVDEDTALEFDSIIFSLRQQGHTDITVGTTKALVLLIILILLFLSETIAMLATPTAVAECKTREER